MCDDAMKGKRDKGFNPKKLVPTVMTAIAYGLLVQGDFADVGSWANVTYIQFAQLFFGIVPMIMMMVMENSNMKMVKLIRMVKMMLPLAGIFVWADAADDDGKSNDIYSYFSLGLFVMQTGMGMKMMKKGKGKGRGKGMRD